MPSYFQRMAKCLTSREAFWKRECLLTTVCLVAAVAVIVIWHRSRRRRPVASTRAGRPGAPSTAAAATTTGSNVVDELRKVAKGVVTISTMSIVLSPTFEPIEEALIALQALVKVADIYLITMVTSDDEERQARAALDRAVGVGVNPAKLLFCESAVGKAAMARQLDACLHVDNDRELAEQMRKHLRVLLISPTATASVANLVSSTSLTRFFVPSAAPTAATTQTPGKTE